MSVSGGPDIITDGLILSLDAANNKSYPRSGSVWRDSSNNNNDFNLPGSFTFLNEYGGGINLNGSSIQCSNNTLGNFGTSSFSINLFCNIFNIEASFGGYLTKRGTTTSTSSFTGFTFRYSTGFYYDITPNLMNSSTQIHILSSICFYSFVAERSNNGLNNTLRQYRNGQLISSVTNNSFTLGNLTNSDSLIIGNAQGRPYDTNSNLYNVTVYNRALSQTEVLQNYNTLKSRFFL
jgi:hypothetical protein